MKKIMLTLIAGLLFLPMTTQAATFEASDEVNVDRLTSDDLYVAGEVVRVFSDVSGDLFSAGGKVSIEGNVSQDIMAFGGEITTSGEVADDVRMAGGRVTIDSTIKGDLLVAGGDISLTSDSFVGGDLIVAGGAVFLGGVINGDVKVAGGEIHINSEIRGSAALLKFDKISFGPNARIVGTLWYRSHEEIEIPEGMVGGEVTFKQIESVTVEDNLPAIAAGFSLYSFLATLFFGLFFIWVYRYFIINSVGRSYEATLKSLGVGFLVVILTPIAMLILFATVIGIPFALVTLAGWLIFLYLGKVMAAMLIGFKIIKVDLKSRFGRIFGGFALGALIFALIGLVPVIGWIINFIFVLIALGGMTSHTIEVSQHMKKKKLC